MSEFEYHKCPYYEPTKLVIEEGDNTGFNTFCCGIPHDIRRERQSLDEVLKLKKADGSALEIDGTKFLLDPENWGDRWCSRISEPPALVEALGEGLYYELDEMSQRRVAIHHGGEVLTPMFDHCPFRKK